MPHTFLQEDLCIETKKTVQIECSVKGNETILESLLSFVFLLKHTDPWAKGVSFPDDQW